MTAPYAEPIEQVYHPTSRIIHWVTALLVLIVLPVGFVIKFVAKDEQPGFYLVHELFGFLILWVMLARIAARLIWPAPPTTEQDPRLRRVAATVHIALYVALVLQPIFGFLATNAFGFPLQWFGFLPIPSPIGKDPGLAPILMGVHVVLGYSILALFCLHFCGVFYHHVIRRDATLLRML